MNPWLKIAEIGRLALLKQDPLRLQQSVIADKEAFASHVRLRERLTSFAERMNTPGFLKEMDNLREALALTRDLAAFDLLDPDDALRQNVVEVNIVAMPRVLAENDARGWDLTDEEIREIRKETARELEASDVLDLLEVNPGYYDAIVTEAIRKIFR